MALAHLRRTLEVVGGTGRDVAIVHDLLGDAATQEHGEVIDHLALGLQESILARDGKRVAKSLTTRDDRNLVDGIGVVEQMTHERMTGLMVGNRRLLLLGHDATLALGTGNDALHGLGDLIVGDDALAATGGQQRRLVKPGWRGRHP